MIGMTVWVLAAMHARALPPLDPAATLAAASEIGVGPEALACAGLNADAGGALLDRVSRAGDVVATLAAAHAQADSLSVAYAGIVEQLRVTPDDADLQAALASTADSLAAARSAITGGQSSLLQAATDGLSSEAIAKLGNYIAASARAVPCPFRVESHTDDEWAGIEKALVAESRALRLNAQPADAPAALLSGVRSDPAVAQAVTSFDGNIAALRAVFQPQ
jgi:hypothetical protein